MSNRVNPPPVVRFHQRNPYKPGSSEFRFADDVMSVIRQQNTIIEQLWRRTGAGEDLVAETEQISNTNFYANTLFDDESDCQFYTQGEPASEDTSFYPVYENDMRLGEQSAVNSTTTPLSGAATFTGTAEQNDYPDVMCSCYADVAGTLYFDFSVNGTDWRTFPVSGFSVAAGIHEFHTAVKGPRWFRVRFVNGSSAQTTFQLFTYYGIFAKAPNAPLNQSLGLDTDASVTRPTAFQDEVTRGLRSGVSVLNKFSYRSDVDTADGEALVIADNTTNTPTILTTASTFTITYNNATDGDTTTGALSLLITYLDSNQVTQTGTHTLGSSGSDTTSFSGLGINRVVVLSSGSANVNTNDITITATTGGSVQAFVPAGDSVTQQLWFHVPANSVGVAKFLFINANKISGGGSPRVTFRVNVYSRTTSTVYEVFRYIMDTSVENHIELIDPANFAFSAGDVGYITAETDTINTAVSARLSLNIYDAV